MSAANQQGRSLYNLYIKKPSTTTRLASKKRFLDDDIV